MASQPKARAGSSATHDDTDTPTHHHADATIDTAHTGDALTAAATAGAAGGAASATSAADSEAAVFTPTDADYNEDAALAAALTASTTPTATDTPNTQPIIQVCLKTQNLPEDNNQFLQAIAPYLVQCKYLIINLLVSNGLPYHATLLASRYPELLEADTSFWFWALEFGHLRMVKTLGITANDVGVGGASTTKTMPANLIQPHTLAAIVDCPAFPVTLLLNPIDDAGNTTLQRMLEHSDNDPTQIMALIKRMQAQGCLKKLTQHANTNGFNTLQSLLITWLSTQYDAPRSSTPAQPPKQAKGKKTQVNRANHLLWTQAQQQLEADKTKRRQAEAQKQRSHTLQADKVKLLKAIEKANPGCIIKALTQGSDFNLLHFVLQGDRSFEWDRGSNNPLLSYIISLAGNDETKLRAIFLKENALGENLIRIAIDSSLDNRVSVRNAASAAALVTTTTTSAAAAANTCASVPAAINATSHMGATQNENYQMLWFLFNEHNVETNKPAGTPTPFTNILREVFSDEAIFDRCFAFIDIDATLFFRIVSFCRDQQLSIAATSSAANGAVAATHNDDDDDDAAQASTIATSTPTAMVAYTAQRFKALNNEQTLGLVLLEKELNSFNASALIYILKHMQNALIEKIITLFADFTPNAEEKEILLHFLRDTTAVHPAADYFEAVVAVTANKKKSSASTKSAFDAHYGLLLTVNIIINTYIVCSKDQDYPDYVDNIAACTELVDVKRRAAQQVQQAKHEGDVSQTFADYYDEAVKAMRQNSAYSLQFIPRYLEFVYHGSTTIKPQTLNKLICLVNTNQYYFIAIFHQQIQVFLTDDYDNYLKQDAYKNIIGLYLEGKQLEAVEKSLRAIAIQIIITQSDTFLQELDARLAESPSSVSDAQRLTLKKQFAIGMLNAWLAVADDIYPRFKRKKLQRALTLNTDVTAATTTTTTTTAAAASTHSSRHSSDSSSRSNDDNSRPSQPQVTTRVDELTGASAASAAAGSAHAPNTNQNAWASFFKKKNESQAQHRYVDYDPAIIVTVLLKRWPDLLESKSSKQFTHPHTQRRIAEQVSFIGLWACLENFIPIDEIVQHENKAENQKKITKPVIQLNATRLPTTLARVTTAMNQHMLSTRFDATVAEKKIQYLIKCTNITDENTAQTCVDALNTALLALVRQPNLSEVGLRMVNVLIRLIRDYTNGQALSFDTTTREIARFIQGERNAHFKNLNLTHALAYADEVKSAEPTPIDGLLNNIVKRLGYPKKLKPNDRVISTTDSHVFLYYAVATCLAGSYRPSNSTCNAGLSTIVSNFATEPLHPLTSEMPPELTVLATRLTQPEMQGSDAYRALITAIDDGNNARTPAYVHLRTALERIGQALRLILNHSVANANQPNTANGSAAAAATTADTSSASTDVSELIPDLSGLCERDFNIVIHLGLRLAMLLEYMNQKDRYDDEALDELIEFLAVGRNDLQSNWLPILINFEEYLIGDRSTSEVSFPVFFFHNLSASIAATQVTAATSTTTTTTTTSPTPTTTDSAHQYGAATLSALIKQLKSTTSNSYSYNRNHGKLFENDTMTVDEAWHWLLKKNDFIKHSVFSKARIIDTPQTKLVRRLIISVLLLTPMSADLANQQARRIIITMRKLLETQSSTADITILCCLKVLLDALEQNPIAFRANLLDLLKPCKIRGSKAEKAYAKGVNDIIAVVNDHLLLLGDTIDGNATPVAAVAAATTTTTTTTASPSKPPNRISIGWLREHSRATVSQDEADPVLIADYLDRIHMFVAAIEQKDNAIKPIVLNIKYCQRLPTTAPATATASGDSIDESLARHVLLKPIYAFTRQKFPTLPAVAHCTTHDALVALARQHPSIQQAISAFIDTILKPGHRSANWIASIQPQAATVTAPEIVDQVGRAYGDV